MALDRIECFEILDKEHFVIYDKVDFDIYFDDVIGVTKTMRDISQKVVFIVDKANAPYVKTKPFHSSQEIISEDENGTTFSIQVTLNFELEREILGFGENIKVISPRLLVKKISRRLESTNSIYDQNSSNN